MSCTPTIITSSCSPGAFENDGVAGKEQRKPRLELVHRARPKRTPALEERGAVGWAIFEARTAAGLTEQQLADRIGTSVTNIGRWERGERTINGVDYKRLEKALEGRLPPLPSLVPNFKRVALPRFMVTREDRILLRELLDDYERADRNKIANESAT